MTDDAWIDTVRIARDLGAVSALLPEGISHLGDCPFPLHRAIIDGLRVLSYEEFPIEERPPKRIWHSPEKLNAWWDDINAAREAKYKSPDADDGGDYDENALELISRG